MGDQPQGAPYTLCEFQSDVERALDRLSRDGPDVGPVGASEAIDKIADAAGDLFDALNRRECDGG